jgi:hypothetical protein
VEIDSTAVTWLARVAFGIEAAAGGEQLGPSTPLVTFGPAGDRSTWTLGEFQIEAGFASPEQRAAATNRERLIAFIEGLIARNEMIRRARDMNLPEDPDVLRARERNLEDWIYSYARRERAESLEIPEDSIRAHYEAHRQDFMIGERVRVHEILLADLEEARRVMALLGSESFEDLAVRFSIRDGGPERRGDLGFATREQLGLLAEPVFGASEGEVIGPLEIQGRYAILRVGERMSPSPAPLEAVRQTITARLRYIMDRRAILAYVKSLRGQASISTNDSILVSIPLTRNDSKST